MSLVLSKMKVGYLPLINKGGGVFNDVFDWESTNVIIEQTIQVIESINSEVIYNGTPVNSPSDYKIIETLFLEKRIDVLFVHTLNISGGESLYKLIQHLQVPVIIAAVPEPDMLFNAPYTHRYASFCGGQWNVNMMYLLDKKVKFLFGLPQEEQFQKDLDVTLQTINIIRHLTDWKVCVVGDKTPGYYGAICSEDMLMRKFGAVKCYLDFGMLKKLCKDISEEEINAFISKEYSLHKVAPQLKSLHIKNTVRIFLALQDYAKREGINSYTMKCVPETIEVLGAAPCGVNSLLTEHDLISGCEGDILSTLSMYIASLYSKRASLMVDIMSIRSPNDANCMLVWHCGAGAPSIAAQNEVTYRESPLLINCDGIPQGVCVDFIPSFSTITMSQLSEDWKNGQYRYFAISGKAAETKPYIGGNALNIQFPLSAEEIGHTIIDNALPHHFQISNGDILAYIKELCYWKDIHFIAD